MSLTLKERQSLFQTVLNKFLLKNRTFKGTMTTGIGVMIIIGSLLSLISIWIPIGFGFFTVFKGMRNMRNGYKTKLTTCEAKVIILIESENG